MTTFVFDFDQTIAATECRTFKDYSEPSFIENATDLPLTSFAAKISIHHKVVILTARSLANGIEDAINLFCSQRFINAQIIGVGDLYHDVEVMGVRKMRKLRTEEKKARLLSELIKNGPVYFWDNDEKNIELAKQVKGVITTLVMSS